jgi:hypothetical protein
MSASLVFPSVATGRPFFSPPLSTYPAVGSVSKTAELLAKVGALSKLAAVVPASRLNASPETEMVPTGIPQLDALAGGLARGGLTEICGAASSGRTSVLLFALAQATRRGEVCALVDASDAFDPASAAAAGIDLRRLLWVRCGEKYLAHKIPSAGTYDRAKTSASYSGLSAASVVAEGRLAPHQKDFSQRKTRPDRLSEWQLGQLLKVTDLLLQSNGFGMIVLDLGDIPVGSARRIPLASWFRFRRAVERMPTVLLVLEQQPIAGSCSSLRIKVSAVSAQLSGNRPTHSALPHSELLEKFDITAELLQSRLVKSSRKPVQSSASFPSQATWARSSRVFSSQ